MHDLEIVRLGRIGYADALEVMEDRFVRRIRGEVPDCLFLLEHEPVVTLGRRANESNILLDREALSARGIDLHHTGRGGDVTYHGPGQIVGYPVIELRRRDVRCYVRDLEEVMIRVCADYDVKAGRVDGLIGAWIESRRKIGAIGVRLSRWVTSHGFALNVNNDLGGFGVIVPCGISDRGVTSIAAETGATPSFEEALDRVEGHFCAVFQNEARQACPT